MGAARELQLARALHKSRNEAGPMRWRDFSADVTRAAKKRLRRTKVWLLLTGLGRGSPSKSLFG